IASPYDGARALPPPAARRAVRSRFAMAPPAWVPNRGPPRLSTADTAHRYVDLASTCHRHAPLSRRRERIRMPPQPLPVPVILPADARRLGRALEFAAERHG